MAKCNAVSYTHLFTKPLALIIRLFANIMAGHAIALSFAAIIFIMFNISENAIANYVACLLYTSQPS